VTAVDISGRRGGDLPSKGVIFLGAKKGETGGSRGKIGNLFFQPDFTQTFFSGIGLNAPDKGKIGR